MWGLTRLMPSINIRYNKISVLCSNNLTIAKFIQNWIIFFSKFKTTFDLELHCTKHYNQDEYEVYSHGRSRLTVSINITTLTSLICPCKFSAAKLVCPNWKATENGYLLPSGPYLQYNGRPARPLYSGLGMTFTRLQGNRQRATLTFILRNKLILAVRWGQ